MTDHSFLSVADRALPPHDYLNHASVPAASYQRELRGGGRISWLRAQGGWRLSRVSHALLSVPDARTAATPTGRAGLDGRLSGSVADERAVREFGPRRSGRSCALERFDHRNDSLRLW